jgi:hypothetical protein
MVPSSEEEGQGPNLVAETGDKRHNTNEAASFPNKNNNKTPR